MSKITVFLTVFLDEVTVKYGIKERNYNSFLNKEETMNLIYSSLMNCEKYLS